MIIRSRCSEDVVMYFINIFLFSSLPDSPVSVGHFKLVESGEFENYPWGKLVFNKTYTSLKKAFRGKKAKKYSRLYGFPLTFQIWFYECCPRTKDQLLCLLSIESLAYLARK